MSHFAKVKDNLVLQVLRAEQDFIDGLPKEDGVSWIQTSYNTFGGKHYLPQTTNADGEAVLKEDDKPPLRGNYAGIGYTYDSSLDAFIPPKPPFDSWVLNKSTYLWESPIPQPSDMHSRKSGLYQWQEDVYKADNTKGWVWEDIPELDNKGKVYPDA